MDSSAESADHDPVTGLSRKEKEDVRQTWTIVRQDLKAAGYGFFQAFFLAYPEYQNNFKGFASVPIESLSENRSFQIHAMNVMNAISSVVDALDDPSSLVGELEKLGTNHTKRKIEKIHFQNLAVVLVAFLQKALGPLLTEEAKQSWTKTLNVVISVIETTLEK